VPGHYTGRVRSLCTVLEVINNQPEDNRMDVAVLGEILDESVVGELASLGKTVDAVADFDENVSVVDEGLELILLHDAGIDFDGDAHVLVIFHRSSCADRHPQKVSGLQGSDDGSSCAQSVVSDF
jgi:hypothetical protein